MASHAIGVIGLGRMGAQIARRLHKKGFKIIAWNRSLGPREELKKFFKNSRGLRSAVVDSVSKLVEGLPKPKIIWVMLPSGDTTSAFLKELRGMLKKGDIVIDGGNSFYRETIKNAKEFSKAGINFLDSGTSGGVWGERNGFSIMVGGDKKVFKKIEPVFRALAAPSPLSPPTGGEGKGGGYSYGLVGGHGAGHFVKMVHNGIEYGMMEAIAEGLAIINKWNQKIDLAEVTRIWEKGSVVSSWLVELANNIFKQEDLSKISGFIHHTGEGEWTIKTAKKLGIDARVIADSFKVRQESSAAKNQKKFSNKIVALLRNQFGGHEVTRK